MARRRDYYDVLGVPRGASSEEVQRAYRRLARRHHPDVNKEPGAEERFKEITEAYDTLSDPQRRRRYDQFGHDWRQVPEEAAQSAGGHGPWASGPPWSGGTADAGGGIDIDDLFGGFFGDRVGGDGFGRGPVSGADAEADITISVAEAYGGTRRRLALPGGRPLEVTIPAGVVDGQRIRLAGQGSGGVRGGRAGDLYLIVHVGPDPRYRLRGRDITVELPVAPWEAALGATVRGDGPGGSFQVSVPAGSSCGRRLRMRRQGLPNPRGSPGDLYVEVKILVPAKLSAEERRLFEELARVSPFTAR
jgi:curved DNA-binding protein